MACHWLFLFCLLIGQALGTTTQKTPLHTTVNTLSSQKSQTLETAIQMPSNPTAAPPPVQQEKPRSDGWLGAVCAAITVMNVVSGFAILIGLHRLYTLQGDAEAMSDHFALVSAAAVRVGIGPTARRNFEKTVGTKPEIARLMVR